MSPLQQHDHYMAKSDHYDKIGSWFLGGTCLLAFFFIATTWFSFGRFYGDANLIKASHYLVGLPAIAAAVCCIASKRFEMKAKGETLSDQMPSFLKD